MFAIALQYVMRTEHQKARESVQLIAFLNYIDTRPFLLKLNAGQTLIPNN